MFARMCRNEDMLDVFRLRRCSLHGTKDQRRYDEKQRILSTLIFVAPFTDFSKEDAILKPTARPGNTTNNPGIAQTQQLSGQRSDHLEVAREESPDEARCRDLETSRGGRPLQLLGTLLQRVPPEFRYL